MKKSNKIWIAASAILTLFACSKEPESPVKPEDPKDVNLTITADYPSEITAADGLELPKWNTTSESIRLFESNSEGFTIKKIESESVAEDGSNAIFKTVLAYDKGNTFNYWAVAPAASVSESGNKDIKAVRLTLPAVQSPAEGGLDHNADLIVSKKVSEAKQPEELHMEFVRPVAVLELNIEGIEDGEKISEITFSNSSAVLAGTMTYNLVEEKVMSFEGAGQIIVKDIDITASQAGTKVFFTVFPGEIDDYNVTVTTNHTNYSKSKVADGDKVFMKANTVTVIDVKSMDKTSLHKVTFPKWDESAEQSYQGGQIGIEYSIENPVEGGSIIASTTDKNFIKNLRTENGKLMFDLAENDTDKVKNYTINVEYVQNEKVLFTTQVKVKQAAMPDPPILNITWDEAIELSAEGGSFSMPYSIENPVDGAELTISSMYNYIKSPKAEGGNINFTLEANPEQKTRTDYMFCEYKKGSKILISKNLTVRQAAKKSAELSFSLRLDKIESDGVYIYLTPSDLNATYVVETVEKSVFDSMSEDDYIQSKITEWGEDFFDDITYHLKSGEQVYQKILCDKPGTLYYVVVYGLNEDGSRTTTNVTKAEFKSANPVLPPKIRIDTNTWDNTMSPRPEDNAHYDVTVFIENPVEGTELKATTTVEWIKNLTVSKVTEEQYTVSFDTGKCKHYGTPYEIKLTYGKARARTIEMY